MLAEGLSALSALSKMGGSDAPQQSSAATSANSGLGAFAPVNKISIGKSMLDFSDPLSLVPYAIAAVIAIYVYKKGLK